MWGYNHTESLCHYGIKGMKWGRRRYRNKDGSFTSEGKRRLKSDSETTNDRKAKLEKAKDGLAYAGKLAASVALVYGAHKAAEFCATELVNAGFDAVEKLLKK